MAPPILEVQGFGKQFCLHEQGKVIPSAQGVSFKVLPGQLTALIGATGIGKSSVLKGIYRTYLPFAGRVVYRSADGSMEDLQVASEHRILELRRGEISFVTQFLHCLPRKATLDVVSQPLLAQGLLGAEAQGRAEELLRAMKLPERLWSVSPATFSGGERQRVNLARGFISRPRLLLLDEPTASLDSDTAECVIRLIHGLKAAGTGMLAIFHQTDMTQRLADQVLELTPPVPLPEPAGAAA
jgi:alpha-D-ribose 1-methylphosphonate 5-triphosphate synthase subunit PhnL